MFSRTFATLAAVLLLGWPSMVLAAGFPTEFPRGYCKISADGSRVNVIASNTDDKSYACLVSCKLNVAGQRAFDPFECRFSLRAHAAEKSVCERKGSGPGHFTKVNSGGFTCSPR